LIFIGFNICRTQAIIWEPIWESMGEYGM